MAGVAKLKPYKKREKKHGKTTFVRPSQKKSVKNGRHQEQQVGDKKLTKAKAKVAKAVASIPAGLDGAMITEFDSDSVLESDMHDEGFCLNEPEEDFDDTSESN